MKISLGGGIIHNERVKRRASYSRNMNTPDPKKYRSEMMEFRTEKGIKKQLIVAALPCSRKDLIKKGERVAKENNWKLR